jgi:hypothetical protein
MYKEVVKSWFTDTLHSVNATLVEHQIHLEQLRISMEQPSYANDLQVNDVMEVRAVLDEAFMALGDALLRLTAADGLTISVNQLVPPAGGKVHAAPHITDAVQYIKVTQESLKQLSIHVRAMAMPFTGETTRAVLIGGEVAVAQELVIKICEQWGNVLQCIDKARSKFLD